MKMKYTPSQIKHIRKQIKAANKLLWDLEKQVRREEQRADERYLNVEERIFEGVATKKQKQEWKALGKYIRQLDKVTF